MISAILKVFLLILLIYSSFVSIYINLIKKQYDLLSLFFSFSLCSFCLLLFYHIYKNPFKKTIKTNKKTILILGVCFVSLLIGFFKVHAQYSRGLHVAEIGQASESKNIMEFSYRQQQPPLDYYFSAFSRQMLSESKLSVRFHAMVFYLLLCFIFPLGLYYYSSFLISALGSLLFLINHTTSLHSVDARPLNLALITGFLLLFFYINFALSEKKQSLIPLICSQYLFIISIGLQPLIFIMSLFISSFWLFFYSQKETFKKLFLSHVITAGLSFPFYFKMLVFGRSASKFKDISFSSIADYFNQWNLSLFVEKYFFAFYDKMLLSFLFPVLGWLFLILLKKQKLNKKTLLLLSSTIIFPLFFDAFFMLGIQYHSNNWYFITFSLFLVFCFVFICQALNSYLKQKKYYFYILIPFLTLFCINSYLQALKIKNETRFYYPYQDDSIEKVYAYLKLRGNLEDFILEFKLIAFLSDIFVNEIQLQLQQSFFHDPNTHPSSFISTEIPYTRKEPFFYELGNIRIYYNEKINYKSNNQTIFFISNKEVEHREDVSEKILSQFFQKKTIGRFVVFEYILSSNDKEQEYISLLRKIKNKTPEQYQSSLLETLLYYYFKKKEKTKFNRLLKEYKELKKQLPEYTVRFKYPIHFDHQRRINFFESLDWSSEAGISSNE